MKTRIFTIVTLLSVSLLGWAEYTDYISLTSLETYTQDFDAIGGDDVTETQIAASLDGKRSFDRATDLPDGWRVENNTSAVRSRGSFAAASTKTMYIGGVNLPDKARNGTWNFGATGSTDRAVGGITTKADNGARTINVMARLKNNTDFDIKSLAISYDIEKYRKGSLEAGFSIQLFTSPDGGATTWTRVGEGYRKVFKADSETAGAPVVPIRTKHVSGAFDVSFAKNSYLYILWSISPATGQDANKAQAIGIDNVSITPSASATSPVAPVPSDELFATYQKFGDRFYEGNAEANLGAPSHEWDVNYYIVSCGDSVLLRATTEESSNDLGAEGKTQLRIWTEAYNNSNEIQTDAGVGDDKNRYTNTCKSIASSADNVKLHFFLDWNNNITTKTLNYNRASINNPIEDNVAPVIIPSDVTMTESDGKLVFTFGEVTADDEYFYYVADKDHNLGGISLNNKVYITKPTIEEGTTYKFKCYAVDYNGNKSEYKEFTLEMPFDEDLNLAFADDAESENSTVIATYADKQANVTLNRNIFADGTWYTLCLPFDMSAEKVNEVFGASTIAELASAEDHGSLISLKFDYVHAIEAGKAYLIKAGNNLTAGTVIPNVQIKNVDPIVSVAKDGETDLMHFQGTYNKTTLMGANIRFVAADNYLYSPNSAGTLMGAFRCYFTIPTGSPASAPGKRARIVMGEQTATGVQNVQSNQVSYTKVLRDGQLLIIREGRMYNAQGMIVSE